MRLAEILLLYGIIGVACAVAVLRRERERGLVPAALSAAATLLLWPLWAPFVLATPRPRPRVTSNERAQPARPAALARIDRALEEAVKSVAGTSMAPMFSQEIARRIAAEVATVAARMAELSLLSELHASDRQASAARLRDLEARAAPERTVATARHKHESLARLEELYARDVQALDELADLLEALRAQLLLARYAGSSEDGTGALVGEVWARLEGLGAAFADERPAAPTHDAA